MARAIEASPGSVTTVVVGRDPKRLEAFRDRHGIARAVTSLEDALSVTDVDVVYVGTPNHLHHEATIVAAAAGKAILSEKSLTVSMEQADALLASVRGTVFFVEGLMYLAHPIVARFGRREVLLLVREHHADEPGLAVAVVKHLELVSAGG